MFSVTGSGLRLEHRTVIGVIGPVWSHGDDTLPCAHDRRVGLDADRPPQPDRVVARREVVWQDHFFAVSIDALLYPSRPVGGQRGCGFRGRSECARADYSGGADHPAGLQELAPIDVTQCSPCTTRPGARALPWPAAARVPASFDAVKAKAMTMDNDSQFATEGVGWAVVHPFR